MNLNEYVNNATRTESQISELKTNKDVTLNVMALFIAAGNMLDQIKKHVFYKKPYNRMELDYLQTTASATASKLESTFCRTSVEIENESSLNMDPRLFHAIIGIATEATELMEALLLALTGEKKLDTINVLEEFGDLNWYEAIGIDALNGNFENVLVTNIDKLRERFPKKFTNEHAINRNTKKERTLLEENL